ncbi:MAG: hypothetical protein V1859_10035 [archaeon]
MTTTSIPAKQIEEAIADIATKLFGSQFVDITGMERSYHGLNYPKVAEVTPELPASPFWMTDVKTAYHVTSAKKFFDVAIGYTGYNLSEETPRDQIDTIELRVGIALRSGTNQPLEDERIFVTSLPHGTYIDISGADNIPMDVTEVRIKGVSGCYSTANIGAGVTNPMHKAEYLFHSQPADQFPTEIAVQAIEEIVSKVYAAARIEGILPR